MNLSERYVWLCLRVGRHVEGFIDAYVGPTEWERTVAAEELVDPGQLGEDAHALLAGLSDADLEQDRRRWLRGQREAIAWNIARLSGDDPTWSDEVERCLGAPPMRTDTAVFEEVQRRLDAALAGSGSVYDRYNTWDERNAIPREQLVP